MGDLSQSEIEHESLGHPMRLYVFVCLLPIPLSPPCDQESSKVVHLRNPFPRSYSRFKPREGHFGDGSKKQRVEKGPEEMTFMAGWSRV